jgi:hypothetical protein
MDLAAKVHYSFLPGSYDNAFLEIAVKAIPFDRIGSDYYSVPMVSDDKRVVCMCDTVGHGTASALFEEIFSGGGQVIDDILVMTITIM